MTKNLQNSPLHWVRATGTSMVPFILPGSRLGVEPVTDGVPLREGDVVCFIDEGQRGVAHRIVRILREKGSCRFWVRGDAQKMSEEVPVESLVYRVRYVARGPISYDCRGIAGRVISHIALRRPVPYRCTRAGLRGFWHVAVRLNRLCRSPRNNSK